MYLWDKENYIFKNNLEVLSIKNEKKVYSAAGTVDGTTVVDYFLKHSRILGKIQDGSALIL